MKFALSIILAFTIGTNMVARTPDKLDNLRTQKKIIRMDKAVEPYYAIQIIALKLPPGEPGFFKQVDVAYEFPCADGYVRYCVGQFSSYQAALAQLESVRARGYSQAFVVNTKKYVLDGSSWTSLAAVKIDPNKTYTVQLSAFRFPVYLTHFKDLEDVMEFRMKDKLFRYCVGKYPGSSAKEELARIKAKGYKDAHLVELDAYLPFQIE
jgi:hypothetical protein